MKTKRRQRGEGGEVIGARMKGGGALGVGNNPIGTIRDSSSQQADVLLVDGLCSVALRS